MSPSRRWIIFLSLATASTCLAVPGKVGGWGDNYSGQSGPWLDPPPGGTLKISARGGLGLSLLTNGTVQGWGDNTFNQDKPPLGLTNVIAVAAGNYHGLALKFGGTIVGWGNDGNGQASAPSISNVTRIAAGGRHSLALLPSGNVVCWGDNGSGQAFLSPGFNSNIVEIAAGDSFSIALKGDGSVIAWGDGTNGQLAISPSITGVVAIAAGERHGLALMSGGIVAGWGDNSAGQALPPPTLSNAVAIAAGDKHSLALLSNGTVVGWGDDSYGQATPPGGLSNVVAIAAGHDASFALRSNGTIVRWGLSVVKIPPAGIPDAIAVAGGGAHSLALLSNSTIVAWGENGYGQATPPGGLTNIIAISAGMEHSLALRSDGTVFAWGHNNQGQSFVPGGLTGVVKIAAGYFFSLALKSDGTVAHWGDSFAIPPGGLSNVVDIAAGGYHGLAKLTDGSVVGWGMNTFGQASPPGVSNTIALAAGEYFSLALLSNGSVASWGTANFGLTSSPYFSNAVAIAAGRQHAMVLKGDGGIATWGDNYYQQIPAPAGAPPALGIGAGAYHSLGIFTKPPFLSGMPTNQVVFAGSNATFSVTASGTPPLSYLWRLNGFFIGGATAATYAVINAQPTNAGTYDVIVGNAAGSVTSAPATLTIVVPPAINAGPASQGVVVSNPASFSVTATGTAPLLYQWQFNGTNIGGATATNLTIGIAMPANAGSYAVIVSNVAGSVTSATAILSVLVPPGISVAPQNLAAIAGSTTGFSVSATGTLPLFYQWRKNGTNIAGATGTNYIIAGIQPTDAAAYDVVVTNLVGSITSPFATLSVLLMPTITNQPLSQNLAVGATTSLTVGATGSPTLYYQWRKFGVPIPGAAAPSLPLANVQLSNGGAYDVVVSNGIGSVTSATATVTVQGPPQILTQPQTHGAWTRMDTTFGVTAAGTPIVYYQWRFNSADLAGETSTTLPINGVSFGDAGPYVVVVSNAYGAVTSQVAQLLVRSQTAGGTRNDFDGDGKTDLGVTHGAAGRWKFTVWRNGAWHTISLGRPVAQQWDLLESAAGAVSMSFGVTNDIIAPADYDGDGVTDVAAYRPSNGTWYIIMSGRGQLVTRSFGWSKTIPVPGDYDGDGKADLAVYNPSAGDWYIWNSSDAQTHSGNWGWPSATPVPGDYDGDGRTDIAVYQLSTANWYILTSSNGQARVQNFGWSGVMPVPGDYDGDGKTDLAVFNQPVSDWYVQLSGSGILRVVRTGWTTGDPVQGDYDGDTLTDLGIYSRAGGVWYIMLGANGQLLTGGPITFGGHGYSPITR